MPAKTEVGFLIETSYLRKLRSKLGESDTAELAKLAFTLLQWVTSETRSGRVILSANADGSDVHRLALPGMGTGTKLH